MFPYFELFLGGFYLLHSNLHIPKQSGKFGKLTKSIRFLEILDLAPYMSGTSDKAPIYRLFGVIVHLDVMNAAFSGHYVCYVKNPQNKWFKIDDSKVKLRNFTNTCGTFSLNGYYE